jgi:phosphomannomutase
MNYTYDSAVELLSNSFKAYDVRGIVGDTISEDIALATGAAFVDVLGLVGEEVVIGYDMRPSSINLSEAFAKGAAIAGASKVTIIGLASTDGLYFASGYLNAASAMFTASHNPAQYNGIKLSRAGAKGISRDTGLEEIKFAAARHLSEGTLKGKTPIGEVVYVDMRKEYAQHLRNLVDLSSSRPLKIVVDAANGMAGLTVPHIFGNTSLPESLPFEIVPMFFELDGTFPNHEANPLEPENLIPLQKAVVEHKADLGLAFDGDADRCFIVDENGDPVNPSAIAAIISESEVKKHYASGNTEVPNILYSLTTSRFLKETIEANKGNAIRIKVGHSPAKAEMARTGALFGGEHSAHYYFNNFWGADSGVLAAMYVLEALGKTDGTMSDLSNQYAPYFSSGEINSTVSSVSAATEAVLSDFEHEVETDYLDGVMMTSRSLPEGKWYWVSLRPSNTEPLLRLNVESNDKALMEEIRDRVLRVVRSGF